MSAPAFYFFFTDQGAAVFFYQVFSVFHVNTKLHQTLPSQARSNSTNVATNNFLCTILQLSLDIIRKVQLLAHYQIYSFSKFILKKNLFVPSQLFALEFLSKNWEEVGFVQFLGINFIIMIHEVSILNFDCQNTSFNVETIRTLLKSNGTENLGIDSESLRNTVEYVNKINMFEIDTISSRFSITWQFDTSAHHTEKEKTSFFGHRVYDINFFKDVGKGPHQRFP